MGNDQFSGAKNNKFLKIKLTDKIQECYIKNHFAGKKNKDVNK